MAFYGSVDEHLDELKVRDAIERQEDVLLIIMTRRKLCLPCLPSCVSMCLYI